MDSHMDIQGYPGIINQMDMALYAAGTLQEQLSMGFQLLDVNRLEG
jgi:hypothetical protein